MKTEKSRFGTNDTTSQYCKSSWPKYAFQTVIFILVMLLISCLYECNRRSQLANANLNALTDTVTHFRNRIGTQTASKATLQLSNRQLRDHIISKDKELAELSKEFIQLHSFVKYQTVTKFDTIQITYKDTIPLIFERTGIITDKWYSFGYRSNQNGIQIDSFETWTSATVMTGIKRKWFLGKEILKTDITLSNPNMTVTEITAAEVTLPTQWYRKWYVWAAVGFAGGYFITK